MKMPKDEAELQTLILTVYQTGITHALHTFNNELTILKSEIGHWLESGGELPDNILEQIQNRKKRKEDLPVDPPPIQPLL